MGGYRHNQTMAQAEPTQDEVIVTIDIGLSLARCYHEYKSIVLDVLSTSFPSIVAMQALKKIGTMAISVEPTSNKSPANQSFLNK